MRGSGEGLQIWYRKGIVLNSYKTKGLPAEVTSLGDLPEFCLTYSGCK